MKEEFINDDNRQSKELKEEINQNKEEQEGKKETKRKASHDSKSGKKKEADVDKLLNRLDEYQEKIEKLQSSLDETNDKFLRLFSEFDNYRKRAGRERIELTKTAAEGIITALLPVLDDLERACEMTSGSDENGAGDKGIELIYNKFRGILRQKGLEEIPAEGEEFNTDYHEAITHMPAKDKKQKGKVVEQVQKGYLLNGKVIRYARVVVAN